MGRNRIIDMLLLGAIVCGCTQSELDTPNSVVGTEEISFGISADWATKGVSVGDISEVDELEVYTYFTDGVEWADVIESDQLEGYFSADANDPVILEVADDGSCTYSGGLRYWPTGEDQRLSFITYYPSSGALSRSVDATTGKPSLSLAQAEFAGENDDLLFSALFDQTASSANGIVNLDLEHLLSQITLKANLTGTCEEDALYQNVSYKVEGFTIANLQGNAELEIAADGTTTWNIDTEKPNIAITATQGVTLLSHESSESELTETSTSVMASGQGFFVIPQDIAGARASGDAPTIVVRIAKNYEYTTEVKQDDGTYLDVTTTFDVIYQTSEMGIPAATTDNKWEGGVNYGLLLEFDISLLDQTDTPLTLTSTIYDWTPTTVDVSVSPNTYIYANTNYFEVEKSATYADMIIYTNYDYDLRRHCRKYELDGSPTESAGFTYYTITDLDTWADSGVALDPVLLWSSSVATGSELEYSSLTKYRYTYIEDVLYVVSDSGEQIEVPLDSDGHMESSHFEDSDGWMYFAIEPVAGNSAADFYYKVKRSDRETAGLYTNSTIEDSAYGINKSGDDAVYILRLNIEDDHLMNETGDAYVSSGDTYGYFYGKIGAELLSNGGGLITTKFKVTLKKEL